MLFEACNEGRTRLVRGLIILGADYTYRNMFNDQAIHTASDKGHTDVIRVLVEAGADINSKGKYDCTPLLWAAFSGQLSAAKYLMDSGAEINARNNMCVFHTSNSINRSQYKKYHNHVESNTLHKCKGWTALHRAAEYNHLKVVCELLDRQADRNIQNNGHTALMQARSSNYNDIALVLDDCAISPNDPNVAKVLFTAIQNGNVNVVADLLRRGASIDIRGPAGETPFQLATRFPQLKEQEYDQELSSYNKTGHKPQDSLEMIVQNATDKSNAMAKLFLSQKLSSHDQESITRRVADISDHCRAPHFDVNILGEEQKFYLNSANNDNKETLLDSCVKLGLIPEREEILEIMRRRGRGANRDSQLEKFRIKEEVKRAIPSSVGLRDCLISVSEKYAWSKLKMYFKISASLIMLIIAIGFYVFDVSTDILFTQEMMSKFQKNFYGERNRCRETLQDCYENEERFSDPGEWFTIGVVSGVHVGLSVVVAFIIWATIEFGRECGVASFKNLPIPIVTRIFKFICDIDLYRNRKERGNYSEKEYLAVRKTIVDKISAYENVVNLSLIIEASVEASFQFFLQTTFIIPSVVLAFTDPSRGFEWTQLVNFRYVSIAMSFASFSFGFYKIR